MAENNSLAFKIRKILLNEWDPNRIGDNENLSDEYDPFIGEIETAIMSGSNSEDIEQILLAAEDAQESHALPAERASAALALAKLAQEYRRE